MSMHRRPKVRKGTARLTRVTLPHRDKSQHRKTDDRTEVEKRLDEWAEDNEDNTIWTP